MSNFAVFIIVPQSEGSVGFWGFVWCVKFWDGCLYDSGKSGISFEKLENVGFWTHFPRKSHLNCGI